MAEIPIRGDMFSLTIGGSRAEIRVWRRPDLDSQAGAHNAARMAEEARKLPARGVRAVLLDVKEAPPVAGPKTLAALGEMIGHWGSSRMAIVIVVSHDPIMVLQYKRVVAENAPRSARVTTSLAEAKLWLASAV
jgi:hypothetical protein